MRRPTEPDRKTRTSSPPELQKVVRDLAWFRYSLRRFLRFSEKAARRQGVTAQQHQLLLGVAGYTGRDRATVSDLAEFLQERHHAASELVARCVKRGLVRKAHDTVDRRVVFVSLTHKGEGILSRLAELHRQEVERLKAGLLTAEKPLAPSAQKRTIGNKRPENRTLR
jgi:DNA-binding MarR family transcriptional regulator